MPSRQELNCAYFTVPRSPHRAHQVSNIRNTVCVTKCKLARKKALLVASCDSHTAGVTNFALTINKIETKCVCLSVCLSACLSVCLCDLVRKFGRHICSLDIQSISALEILHNCALQTDIYLLTYLYYEQ